MLYIGAWVIESKKNYPKVASCQPLPLKIKPALCSILKSFKDLHNTILTFPTSLLTFVPPLYSTLGTWRAVNHSSEFRFFRLYSKRCLHYSPLEQNHHQQKGYNNHPFIRCLSYIVCVYVHFCSVPTKAIPAVHFLDAAFNPVGPFSFAQQLKHCPSAIEGAGVKQRSREL